MKHGAKPEKSGDAKPPVLTIRKDSGAAMNTSKGVIMKSVIPSVFSILAAISAMPSAAQSIESGPAAQHIPSVVYKSGAAESQLAGTISVDTVPGVGEGTNTSLKVKYFRPDRLGMTNFRSNTLIKNDWASFTVNAPMPAVNDALSLVGTIYQTPLDGTMTKCIQVLSLLATRKINAEFTYSAPLSKSSRFDSVITYRLHPASGSERSSDVVASFQYNVKF